jgi:hypothetical protein
MKTLKNVLLISLALVAASTAHADSGPAWDGSRPAPGVYFYWYEPSFYTGFAPRTQNRSWVRLELGRGNQQRLTIVLGPDELDTYLEGLLAKRDIVREMLGKGVIELTTNREFERFEEALAEAGVEEAVAQKAELGPEGYREKSVEILRRLNPDRIFAIDIPVDRVAADWHAYLTGLGEEALGSAEARLDAANAVLLGRVNLYESNGEIDAAVKATQDLVVSGKGADGTAFRDQTLKVLELVADSALSAAELRERNLQLMERLNPGRVFRIHIPLAELIRRWAAEVDPKDRESREGDKYDYLWLLSRGPMSHGCTHVNAGHIAELRQVLPSEPEGMGEVDAFINKSHLFDVFDIDGDLEPEVMGVRYFVAYTLSNKKRHTLRVPIERRALISVLCLRKTDAACTG